MISMSYENEIVRFGTFYETINIALKTEKVIRYAQGLTSKNEAIA